MAVTKIWDVRGSLDAPIKYVSNEEKTENPDPLVDRQYMISQSPLSVKRSISYSNLSTTPFCLTALSAFPKVP